MDYRSLQDNEYARGWIQPRPVSIRTLHPTRPWKSPTLLLRLPDEILELIACYLSQPDLSSLTLVNSDCRLLARPFQFCDITLTANSVRTRRLIAVQPDRAGFLPIAPFVRVLRLRPRPLASTDDYEADSEKICGLLSSLSNLAALSYENEHDKSVLLDLETLSAISSSGIRHLHLSNVKFPEGWRKAAKMTWKLETLILDKIDVHSAYIMARRSSQTLRHFTLERNIQHESQPNDGHSCSLARGARFPELTSLRIAGGPSMCGAYLTSFQKSSPQLKSIEYSGPMDHAFYLCDTIPSLKHCRFEIGFVDMLPFLRPKFIAANPQLTSLEIAFRPEVVQVLRDSTRTEEFIQRWLAFVKNIATSLPLLQGLSINTSNAKFSGTLSKGVLDIITEMTTLRHIRLIGYGLRSIAAAKTPTKWSALVNLERLVLRDNMDNLYSKSLDNARYYMRGLRRERTILDRIALYNRLLVVQDLAQVWPKLTWLCIDRYPIEVDKHRRAHYLLKKELSSDAWERFLHDTFAPGQVSVDSWKMGERARYRDRV